MTSACPNMELSSDMAMTSACGMPKYGGYMGAFAPVRCAASYWWSYSKDKKEMSPEQMYEHVLWTVKFHEPCCMSNVVLVFVTSSCSCFSLFWLNNYNSQHAFHFKNVQTCTFLLPLSSTFMTKCGINY